MQRMIRIRLGALILAGFLGIGACATAQAASAETGCVDSYNFHRVMIPHAMFMPGSDAEQVYLTAEQFNNWKLKAVVVLSDVTIYYWQCAEKEA